MVGLGRLELPTSPLSGVRSNHLSYRPDLVFQSRFLFLSFTKQSVWAPSCHLHSSTSRLCKEVIQPQVPLRLPCYDFTPVMNRTVVSDLSCELVYRLLVPPTPMV